MSNYVIIFAAGRGTRMKSSTPKQYLKIMNKPILCHTVDIFEKHPMIDKIVLVVLKDKINFTKKLIKKYKYKKILNIIPGGNNALASQYNGIKFLKENKVNNNDIVLIHDGVRPLIQQKTISKAIKLIKDKGNAITVSPASETTSISDNNIIKSIMPREKCLIIRAPQGFIFKDIYDAHVKARLEKKSFIDSASMMKYYRHNLNTFVGPTENIKVTTINDYVLCKHFLERKTHD